MIQQLKRFKKSKSRVSEKTGQNMFFSAVLVLFVLMIAGFLIFSSIKLSHRKAELNSRIEVLKKEIDDLEEKNQELKTETSIVGNDDYLEKVAKERLNLKKPGEEVVVITKKKEENSEEIKEKTFWEKLLKKFGL